MDLIAVERELLEARVDVLVGVQDPVERQVLQRVGLLGRQAGTAGGRRQALRHLQEDGLHRQLQHSGGGSALQSECSSPILSQTCEGVRNAVQSDGVAARR